MQESPQIDTVFDDSEKHIGRVYATALLKVAGKANAVDSTVDEIQSVVNDVLGNSPQLEMVFKNPRIDASAKLNILDRLFGDKLSGVSLKFLKVLASRQRLGSLSSIAKAASQMRDEAVGRLQVKVTTAQAIEPGQMERLRQHLATVFSADVRVRTTVDPAILGGMVVRVGDTVYDASVDGRLRAMQRQTKTNAEASVRRRLAELSL